jgi:NADPH-dependent 2,4-dienoyl-CoA reductase/sulfur reductase-like enzyme
VTLADGSREEVDLVLLAVGIHPNLEIPTALGLPSEAGGVVLDEGLRAAEGVYCAGDIALHRHPVLGRAIRVEHWEVAKGQGRGIASSVAREHASYSTLPYFWSDQYDVSLEYRGNASGMDGLVWRGDREALSFSVFYIRDGLVDAVLSVNDAATNKAGAALIRSRRRVDAAALADPAVDLAELNSVSA